MRRWWQRFTGKAREELLVEELAPRILFSADAAALLAPDTLLPVAEVRSLDAYASPTDTPTAADVSRSAEPGTALVFIDARVDGIDLLMEDLRAQMDSGNAVEIVVLTAEREGLDQIGESLAGRRDVAAIHIISHGSAGQLQLGSGMVNAETLGDAADSLGAWRAALTADADILLYGCDVADGTEGLAFIEQLAHVTGADVAASSDKTGSASMGGNWTLEHRSGAIEAAMAVGLELQQTWDHTLAIAVDATTTATVATGAADQTVSHTTAGSDRLMLVGISFGKTNGDSVSSVTYDGVALTHVGSQDDVSSESRVEIWRLVAPATGTADVVVTFSGTGHEDATIGVMTFTGVDQSTPLGVFAGAQGDSTSPSVTVASATNELVFGVAAYNNSNNGDFVPGAGQTERWDLFGGGSANGSGTTEAGAASVVTSWTIPDSSKWAAGGVSIKVGASGAPTITNQGGETLVNVGRTTGTQEITAFGGGNVAMAADGSYVVVYTDLNANSGDIYAQRYNAAGVAQGTAILVNGTTANAQFEPSVAMADDGRFVVTWSSWSQDSAGDLGVYARLYAADGTASGAEFRVNTTVAGDQRYSKVGMDDNGNFVVAFTDYSVNDGDVYAQRYNAAGVAQGGNFLVNTSLTDFQSFADIDVHRTGGDFVIVWESFQDGISTDVYGQRFNAAGVAQGSEFRVNTTTAGVQESGHVAYAADGSFAVAWESEGSTIDMMVRRYDASGTALTGEITANTYTSDTQRWGDLAFVGSNSFVVTWGSDAQDGSSVGVYAQQFDATTGAKIGAELKVSTSTTDAQQFPSIAIHGSNAVIVWGGNGTQTSNVDDAGVFMQRYSVTGLPGFTVTPTYGLTTTEAGGTAQFSVVLDAAPTADVTVAVGSSDTSEGTVGTSLLTFTTANWATPQVVTVTGVNDGLADGFQAYSIVLAAASSGDSSYNGLNPADVRLTNSDDDITYGLITVDTTADTSDGDTSSLAALAANRGVDGFISLREAITAANNTANGTSADRIHFNIAGTGTHTISLGSALPFITEGVTLDATTDDSFAANGNKPAIILDGNNLVGSGFELSGTADGSTIRGFVIRDFAGDGITIRIGADNNTIAGNYIGSMLADGTTAGAGEANTDAGIYVQGANNTIGGLTAADRNVLSGNSDGVFLDGATATGNLVIGNYIGTDATGAVALGNSVDGVALNNGASNNTIGGSTSTARNVISGNGDDGIDVKNSATTGNVFRGNFIGTDASGTLALGNSNQGFDIGSQARNFTIGGTSAGDGNLIAFNGSTGIRLFSSGNTGISILGNTLASNGGQAIDLGGDGLTANDAPASLDADTGANNLQNFPVLTSANANTTGTTLAGSLDSTASTSFRIEFFANRPSVADASNGEGERYLGYVDVTTDISGNASIATTLPNVWINAGERVTATATNLTTNETSEFAANVTATSTGIIVVDTASDVSDGTTTSITNLGNSRGADGRISLREALAAANATGGTDRIFFNIAGTGVHTINVTSALPSITGAVILDATTDDSFAANSSRPAIVLDGNNAFAGDGLVLAAGSGNSTIRGFVIRDFTGSGIYVQSDNNTIAGNYVGSLTETGVSAGAGEINTLNGIWMEGIGNTIGGTSAVDRNIFAGNNQNGIGGSGGGNHLILGNHIGVDATGLTALGNNDFGVYFFGATDIVIGGLTSGHRNVISGNGDSGIWLENSTDASILGNYIGVGSDGTTAIGNGWDGITVWDGTGHAIGGTAIDAGNVIANNGDDGIEVALTSAEVAILGNAIRSNASLGIDQGGNNSTAMANDVAESDGIQNHPVIASAVTDTSAVTIAGTLGSTANSHYRIEFFGNVSQDASGHGQGQTVLGFANVATDGSGNATISTTLTVNVAVGTFISATATRATDNTYTSFTETSEFGANQTAVLVNVAPADLYFIPGLAESSLTGVYTFSTQTDLGRDDAGADATMTLFGSPGQTTGPAGSGALDLAGGVSGQYGHIDDITTGGAMTIAGHVRFDSTGDWQRVVDFGQAGSTGITAIYVGRLANTDDLTFTLERDLGVGGLLTYRANAAGAIVNGTWLHFAATVDGSGVMALYVNGVLADTETGIVPEVGVRTNNFVGRSNWAGDALFDGAIDNLVVASGALSAEDLAALYQQSNAFSLPEGTADGTALGTVVVADPNIGSSYTFDMIDGAGGRFAIGTDGTITVADGSLLDHETSASHAITVRGTDAGGLWREESITITVADISDAPAGTDATLTVTEDTIRTFSVADFGFTDADGDNLLRVWIDSLPAGGSLLLRGAAFPAGDWIPASDIAAGLLSYEPAADAAGAGVASFTFRVQDDGGTAGGGSDTDASANTITLDVTPVNDIPTIAALAGDSLAYAEGDGAVVIEQGGDATVTDIDSTNFDGGTLMVSFTAGSDSAEDMLGIRHQGSAGGQIGVSASTVTFGGVAIGTYAGGSTGSPLVITLNANANATAVDALVRNVTYRNTDTTSPTTGARTVRFVLSDGDGGTSATHDTTITVSAVNDAPTFNRGDGKLMTAFATSADVKSVVVQPDGKIVVVGFAGSAIVMARYEANGVLDSGFGTAGLVSTIVGSSSEGWSVALQADGKILVAGTSFNGVNVDFALVRYNADGSLDTSFDTDGMVTTGIGAGNDRAVGVAVQTDGRIVVGGYSHNGSDEDFAVIRYNTDGSLDTTFDTDGRVTTAIGSGDDFANAIVLQSDGRIVLGGYSWNGTDNDFALVRYNTDGTLDATFDTDGRVITAIGSGNDQIESLAIQADGRIVAGGTTTGASDDMALARYNSDGSLDTTFDGDGRVVTVFSAGNDYGSSVAIQSDGKIVLAGRSLGSGNADFAAARYGTTGALDTTFDTDGRVTTDFSGSGDLGRTLAIQSDGKLVVAGMTWNGAGFSAGVIRYNTGGTLDAGFDSAFSNTLDGTPTFIEGGAWVVLDANVQILDAELSAANAFNGASLTLERHAGANAEDLLAFDGTTVTVAGPAVFVGGVQVGTYVFTGGSMSITFGSNATNARVDTLMRNIVYGNASEAPPASVRIDWVFDDGNGGAQGTGGALQVAGSTTVTITSANDAPVAIGDPGAFSAQTLALQPVGYWRLGESSGTTAINLGSLATPGTYVGNPTLGAAGALAGDADSAVDFNGVNQQVNVGTMDVSGTGLTLLGWFSADDFGTADQRIISKALSTGANAEQDHSWMLSTVQISGEHVLRFRVDAGGTTDTLIASSGSLVAGRWYFAAATYDDATGVMNLFLNGTAVGSKVHSSGGAVGVDPTRAVVIGANPNGYGFFDGRIDDVAVFDQALTQAELQGLHAAGVGGYAVNEDGVLAVASAQGVLFNDTDVDGPGLSAVLVSGPANAAAFTLNADGSFTYTPNGNFNGTDSFTYRASDGSLDSNIATVTIIVNAVNDAPVISSDGAGPTAAVNAAENQTAVTTVTSTDVDGGTAVYSIVGGADQALFSIDSATGLLTFDTAPDFETPIDAGGNNIYDVTVQVADGNGGTDAQAIAVTVTNVNEAPVISSDGAGPTAAVNAAENQTAVTTVTRTDVDGGTAVYSIVGGADQALFSIDSATGVLTFDTAPDFETPIDAGGNNIYDVTVQVADGNGGTDTQAIAVTVTNVNEAPTTSTVALTPIAEDSGPRLITQAELLGAAADVDGHALTASGLTISTGSGGLVDNNDGTWTYTPAADDDTSASFSYTVTDGSLTAAGTAALDITPVNDAPTTSLVTLTAIIEDSGPRSITQAELLGGTTDIDGPTLVANGLSIGTGIGGLVDNNDGTWTFTPAVDDESSVTFAYTVTDGMFTTAAQAALDILPVSDPPPPIVISWVPPQEPPPPTPISTPAPTVDPETQGGTDSPPSTATSDRPIEGRSAARRSSGGGASAGFPAPGTGPFAPYLVLTGEAADGDPHLSSGHAFGPSPGSRYSMLSVPGAIAPTVAQTRVLLFDLGIDPALDTTRSLAGVSDIGPVQMPSFDDPESPTSARLLTAEGAVRMTGVAMSAGLVVWALRGGGLLVSLLGSLPAWRNLDPLPVLAPEEDKPEWDVRDDEEAEQEALAFARVRALRSAAGPGEFHL